MTQVPGCGAALPALCRTITWRAVLRVVPHWCSAPPWELPTSPGLPVCPSAPSSSSEAGGAATVSKLNPVPQIYPLRASVPDMVESPQVPGNRLAGLDSGRRPRTNVIDPRCCRICRWSVLARASNKNDTHRTAIIRRRLTQEVVTVYVDVEGRGITHHSVGMP